MHDDLAVEYSVRGAVQNPLIELEASGVRLQVIEADVAAGDSNSSLVRGEGESERPPD